MKTHFKEQNLPVLTVGKLVNPHPMGGQVVICRLVLLTDLKYFPEIKNISRERKYFSGPA